MGSWGRVAGARESLGGLSMPVGFWQLGRSVDLGCGAGSGRQECAVMGCRPLPVQAVIREVESFVLVESAVVSRQAWVSCAGIVGERLLLCCLLAVGRDAVWHSGCAGCCRWCS